MGLVLENVEYLPVMEVCMGENPVDAPAHGSEFGDTAFFY